MTRKRVIELLAAYMVCDYGEYSEEKVKLKYPNSWEERLEAAKKWLEFQENPKYYIRRFNPDQKYLGQNDKFVNRYDITKIVHFTTFDAAVKKAEELAASHTRSSKYHKYTIDKEIK